MNEQKALKKLGIKSFKEINEKNFKNFLEIFEKMDSEVAKKALEQFPEFAKTTSACAKEYKDIAVESIKSNEASVKICLESCQSIIDSLSGKLDENISLEEKQMYMDTMLQVVNIMHEFDKRNKEFLEKTMIIGGIIITTLLTGLVMFLNSNNSTNSGKNGTSL